MLTAIVLALHIFLGAMFGHPVATTAGSSPDCTIEQCSTADLTAQAAANQDPASWGTDNYSNNRGVVALAVHHHHHKAYCVKRHYVHAHTTRNGVHVRGHWVRAYCVKAT